MENTNREIISKRKIEITNDLYDTIEDFYQQAGISGPVEMICDHLHRFFTANDNLEVEDDNTPPLKIYKGYSERQIDYVVYSSISTIKFIVDLKEKFDHFKKYSKMDV
jgi:hypothetical protein